MKNSTTRKLTFTALFAALVFIFSAFLQIPLVTPFGNTRFHLGNVLCLLAGIMLSPGYGGLAAGMGSVIFDLTNPLYFSSAPFTFINKFLMGFVAGHIFKSKLFKNEKTKTIMAAILGQLTYIVLYLINTFVKSYFLMNLSIAATITELTQKGLVSTFNGLISVIIATILARALNNRINFD